MHDVPEPESLRFDATVLSSRFSSRHIKALEHFVTFWGDMASSWGINRTMAQIHALLYAVDEPLDTDTLMVWLDISRGNASMNLRSLMSWNLVRKVHQPGSRKDYYTAEKDVWEITAQIIRERERREINPVKQKLEESRTLLLEPAAPESTYLPESERQFCERIDSLIALMEVFEGFSRTLLPIIRRPNAPILQSLVQFAQALQERPAPDTESSAR